MLATLRAATGKIAQEPQLHEAMERLNLGASYADAPAFHAWMERDNAYFKTLMSKLNLKN